MWLFSYVLPFWNLTKLRKILSNNNKQNRGKSWRKKLKFAIQNVCEEICSSYPLWHGIEFWNIGSLPKPSKRHIGKSKGKMATHAIATLVVVAYRNKEGGKKQILLFLLMRSFENTRVVLFFTLGRKIWWMQFVWQFRIRVGFYYFIVAVEKQKWHCIRMKFGTKVKFKRNSWN